MKIQEYGLPSTARRYADDRCGEWIRALCDKHAWLDLGLTQFLGWGDRIMERSRNRDIPIIIGLILLYSALIGPSYGKHYIKWHWKTWRNKRR